MVPEGSVRQRSVFAFLLTVVLISVAALLGNYFFASGEIQYYVSPTGNDANPGTLEAPFKTITKAAAVLRNNAPAGGAIVHLRGGEYEVSQTISLEQSHSGQAGAPIVYRAYQNETPIIDGTVDLPKPTPLGGNIYSVDMTQLPGVDFRTSGITNLLKNGQTQPLARYPNAAKPNFSNTDPWAGQFLYTASDTPSSKTQFKYSSVEINPASWGSSAQAVIFSGPNYWDSTVAISSVNASTRTVSLSGSTSYDILPGNRYYLENSKAFLDSNGEWFYDKSANKLYIYLSSSPGSTDVFSVVRVGDIFNLSNVSNVAFDGLVVRGSAGTAFNIRASSGSENVTVANGEISVTAREGIRAGGKISNLIIDGNSIHDVGWEGVTVQQDIAYFKTLTGSNNQITNNIITRVGNKWRAKSGVEVYSVGTRVAHNEIYDVPRMAVFFRGNDNVVEFNRIYDTNRETQDSGAIYSFGRSWLYRGNIVRHNYIHDVGGYGQTGGAWRYPFYTFGIYFDDFSSGNLAANNVVVRSGQAGLIVHGGRDNRVENNFLINSLTTDTLAMIGVNNQSSHLAPMWNELAGMEANGYDKAKYFAKYPELNSIKQTMTNEQLYANNRVSKNVLYNVGSEHYAINSRQFRQGVGNVSNNNIFWSDRPYRILDSYQQGIYSFSQWQSFGFDTNSEFSDPGFVNIAGENYSFPLTSPASQLGILPVNVQLTGPERAVITTPIVTIALPGQNDSLSGSAVFSATVYDTTPIHTVTFKIDGTVVDTFKAASGYSKNIDTTSLSNGLHTFVVVAINESGNVGTGSVGFSVSNQSDTENPVVSITNPDDASRVSRTVKITANATDNVAVTKVEFYLNGERLGEDTSAPYTLNWNTRKTDRGKYQLYAKAYDASGNSAVSQTISVSR